MSALSQTRVYSAAQTRELDRLAINSGIAGSVLMQRAGQAAFDLLRQRWPGARRLAVLCGGGNNGGDGYVVAALAQLAGLMPTVYFTTDPQRLSGDARHMAQWCTTLSVPCQPLTMSGLPLEADVLVDGLLGTGLRGQVNDTLREVLLALDALDIPCLALDVPSGLDADTGMPLGAVLTADLTCTFIALKPGLITGLGPVHSGQVRLATLQVPESVYQQVDACYWRPRVEDISLALPKRRADGHKGMYGHVLVVGGNSGFGGAALMTAQAAARSGAGLVSLATHADHVLAALVRQPEIMVRGVHSTADLVPLIDNADVVAIGPGLGQDSWGSRMLSAVLDSGKPMVLDADALNVVAGGLSLPADWQGVMTPHPGEAARLLASTVADVQQDRFAACTELQQQYGGSILLKGCGTLVVGDQKTDRYAPVSAIIDAGNPGMATGGMGDVLTGVIAAFLAQGVGAFNAAALGALAHALAADKCAADGGARGMLASDLLVYLRRLLNEE